MKRYRFKMGDLKLVEEHPAGQRVEDLRVWAKEILERYGSE